MTTEEMLVEIAEKEVEVYKAGKDAFYDFFWDSFQQNGNRADYICAFGGQWKPETFKPKYQIKPQRAYMLFYNNQSSQFRTDDFVAFADELAREQGKTIENNPDLFDENGHYKLIDFSECIEATYALAALWGTHFGELDFSKCTGSSALNALFYSHTNATNGVKRIDKFKVSEATTFNVTKGTSGTFYYATQLTDITIDGNIGKSIDFSQCTKLSRASIESVINALSSNVSGQTASFSLSAVSKAFTDAEWNALTTPITNWNISRV